MKEFRRIFDNWWSDPSVILGTLGGKSASDTTPPTVTITSNASNPTIAAFTCTFTLSEDSTDFTVNSITLGGVGGSKSGFSGSGKVYTAVITPTGSGPVTVDVAAGAFHDAAGNANTAATQFSILYIASLLFAEADDVAGNDGDAVSAWVSKESYSFAQTGTKRPLLKKGANGINGHNALYFDGNDDLLVYAGSITNATSGCVYIVNQLQGALQDTEILLSSADEATAASFLIAFYAYYKALHPDMKIYHGGNAAADNVYGSTTVASGETRLAVFNSDGAAYSMRNNGAAQTLTADAGSNSGDWFGDAANRDNVVIGAGKWQSTEAQFFRGLISAIIVTSDQYSAAVESYLATRYGITLP